MKRKQHPHRLFQKPGTTVVGLALAAGLVTALTTLQYARVGAVSVTQARPPLPVAATSYAQQSQYQREVSYLGLVKASRRTDIGFEMPGLIMALYAREGTEVLAGSALAELDSAKLMASKRATTAELHRVEAELELARIKETRQQDLQKSGAVSREAYDETRLRARALVAQREMVTAQLESIEIDLGKAVLRAPYSGIISERYIDEGTVVTGGTPILRLVEASSREAHIGIAVMQAEKLAPGNDYPLMLRGDKILASLVAIRPDVNPITRAVTAVFQLPATATALDGEPVTLVLTQPVHVTGGWLPISSLIEGERGAWTVLKIEAQGERQLTVREAVEVLEVRGDMAYVRGTIAHGDTLVADGVHKVTPGTPVTQVSVI